MGLAGMGIRRAVAARRRRMDARREVHEVVPASRNGCKSRRAVPALASSGAVGPSNERRVSAAWA